MKAMRGARVSGASLSCSRFRSVWSWMDPFECNRTWLRGPKGREKNIVAFCFGGCLTLWVGANTWPCSLTMFLLSITHGHDNLPELHNTPTRLVWWFQDYIDVCTIMVCTISGLQDERLRSSRLLETLSAEPVRNADLNMGKSPRFSSWFSTRLALVISAWI